MENSNNRYKFRAWDGKRMYYDVQKAYDNFSCNEDDEEKYGDNYTYDADFSFQSFKDVLEGAKAVMQTTGLKDKNGKEIYEGDILRNNLEKSIISIVWDYTGANWKLDEYNIFMDDGFGRGNWDFTLGVAKHCEVIGNVWQNPELLNPAKD